MNRKYYRKMALLMCFLMMFQIAIPAVSAMAATESESTMLPPSNLAAQMVTPDDFKLTWSAVFGATGYNVYGIMDGQLILLGTTKNTYYALNDLSEGSYRYVVSTLDGTNESGPCAPVIIDVAYPDMTTPANLNYSIQNGNDIVLTWGASPYAESYNVYEIKADGQQSLVGTATGVTHKLTNAPAGTYKYAVSAVNAKYGESPISTDVQVNLVHPVMTAPATFTFTATNVNDITLKWSAAAYATGYKIYQVVDGDKVLKGTVTGTSITYPIQPAGEYTFAIHSFSDRFGESADSKQVTGTIGSVAMLAPTNVAYQIKNGNDIVLTWTASANANSYKVYQLVDGEKVLKSTVTGTTVTYTNSPAGEYIFEVYSSSTRFGDSAEGGKVSLNVDFVSIAPPTNAAYQIINGNDIVLTWDLVTNAESYKVYQVVDGQKVLKSTVTGKTVTYTNSPEGQYIFEIHSFSTRFGESVEGAQVSVTLGAVQITAPGNATYKIVNGNDIALTWDPVANANNYRVYQVIGEQKTLKSTVTSTTITYANLPAGAYKYEIYAYSTRFGQSVEGSLITIDLVHPTMQSPANVVQKVKSATEFSLTWESALYANKYKVYQIINGEKVLKSTVTGTIVNFTGMAPGEYTYEVYSNSTRFGDSLTGTKLTFTQNGQVMDEPINPTYTITNGNDITLRWTGVPYANGYKVYQMIDGEKAFKSTVTGTTVTYTNYPAGNLTFVIHSYSTLLGESPDGVTVNIPLVWPVMTAPANLVASVQNGNDVALSWATVPYANNYKIYELVDNQKVLKTTVSTVKTTLTNVPNGEHTYVVHSESLRFGESQLGSQVAVTVDNIIMLPPTNLRYTITNGNDITLSWVASTYANGYRVYQIIDGEKVLKSSPTGTSVAYTNMPAGEYVFEVHSYSTRFGESPESTRLVFDLQAYTMLPPTNLTHTIANGNDITLKWNGSTYAAGYKVYQIVDGEKVLKSTIPAVAVTYVNMPAGDYTYEVHSYNSRFGDSLEAAKISFTLDQVIMQTPTGLKYTITNGNDITLSWNAVTYATNYKIYQVIDNQKVLKNTTTAKALAFTNMPAGEYKFEVHSYSTRFGESPQPSIAQIDLIWPVVQPPSVKGEVFNANNLKLTWPTVTWANEYRVYEVKGSERQLLYKGTALTYSIYNLTEDIHAYEVTAFSTRFGESAPSNRIVENIIYPIMQPPVATLKLLSGTSARISWDFVVYANGYNIYEIVEGNPVLVAEKINNLSYILNNLTYQDHEYYVTSYSNSFGESAPSNQVIAKLIVDTEAPVTTADAPAEWTNVSPITVTLTATDNETGVANTYYAINDGSFVAGTSLTIDNPGITKVSFYSVDKVGNTEATKTIEVKIDKTAPVTQASEVPAWSREAVTITLTATDAESGVAQTFYAIDDAAYVEGTSVIVPTEGSHKVSFYSVDVAGNIEAEQSIYVKVDKTAPVTQASEVPAWSIEAATVTLTATDAESGVAKTFYAIDDAAYVEGTSVIVPSEGSHKVSFYSVDVAGNIEAVQSIYVKVDKTAPITKASEVPAWLREAVTITLTATDAESGVAKTFYAIDDAAYVEGTSVIIPAEENHKVSFYSVDVAGNIEAVQSIYVKVDKTAPVTKASEVPVWSREAVTITLTATDGESGVAKTFYAIDDAAYVEGASVIVPTEGTHKVSFYSVDVAGNIEAVQSIYVKVDKTAPITKANEVPAWSREAVTVTLTATDGESGVAKTFYAIDDAAYVEGTSVNISEDGVHKVSFYSVDVAGNIEAVQKVYVKIDKTAPTLTMDLQGEYALGTTLPLVYSANDNLSGIVDSKMTVLRPNEIDAKVVTNGSSILLDKPGVYKIVVTATNGAGLSTTIEKQFEVFIPISNIEVTPKVLKGNKGVFTVRVDLPKGYQGEGFDLDTVTLNGVSALNGKRDKGNYKYDEDNKGYLNQAKKGQFKFERSDFEWTPSEMVVVFRGYVDGVLVVGQTTVKVQK